jgi:hypothetical protein
MPFIIIYSLIFYIVFIMGRGMLSVETIIIIVMCLLVLIVSTLYLMGIVGPAANNTGTTADIYGECMKWQRFSYSDDTTLFFTKSNYPTLWQTYLSSCLNDKKELDSSKCDGDKVKGFVTQAKNFCTNEKSTETTSSDSPQDACIGLGFSDGACSTDCGTGYTEKGTTPCKNSKKLCCK